MIQKGKDKKVQDERLNVLLRDNTPKTQKYSLGYQIEHPKVQNTLIRVVKRQNPKTQILTRVAKTAPKSAKKHSPGR
jgi:DNA-directed RNA polymerase subunit L